MRRRQLKQVREQGLVCVGLPRVRPRRHHDCHALFLRVDPFEKIPYGPLEIPRVAQLRLVHRIQKKIARLLALFPRPQLVGRADLKRPLQREACQQLQRRKKRRLPYRTKRRRLVPQLRRLAVAGFGDNHCAATASEDLLPALPGPRHRTQSVTMIAPLPLQLGIERHELAIERDMLAHGWPFRSAVRTDPRRAPPSSATL